MGKSMQKILNDYFNKGMSFIALSKKYGLSAGRIANICMKDPRYDGARIYKKRTKKEIQVIIANYLNTSETDKVFCERYNLKKSTLSYWLKKRNINKKEIKRKELEIRRQNSLELLQDMGLVVARNETATEHQKSKVFAMLLKDTIDTQTAAIALKVTIRTVQRWLNERLEK